ncbi:MAG TPA: hypothetical protein DD727_08150 [Clostridiales bacterium]|nr:hypothetical protein [Clostridiales bacterium]
MAKEICMIQRTEKGSQARKYFLRLENAWNTPEMVLSRALKMAERNFESLRLMHLELSAANTAMQPKAEYFDALVERNLLTNFRDTAKELKVGEKFFIRYLLDKKYIYRDKKGKLRPYADRNDGLFELKEIIHEETEWSCVQTFITPKGRETFRLLLNRTLTVPPAGMEEDTPHATDADATFPNIATCRANAQDQIHHEKGEIIP